MVQACIANGGLYVKLGQGLSTMNQVLPEDFYLPLRKLLNEALRSEGTEVNIFKFTLLLHQFFIFARLMPCFWKNSIKNQMKCLKNLIINQ
jgi:hypothetical protein